MTDPRTAPPTQPVTTPAQPLVLVEPGTLNAMTERELSSAAAATNVAFTTAVDVLEAAAENLVAVLTEQIARRVLKDQPDADLLIVNTAVSFCADPDTETGVSVNCTGHDERLVAGELLGMDGREFRPVPPYSPVHFWLERLTDHLEEDGALTLDLRSREWGSRDDDDDYRCQD